jgi:hypothetical protein
MQNNLFSMLLPHVEEFHDTRSNVEGSTLKNFTAFHDEREKKIIQETIQSCTDALLASRRFSFQSPFDPYNTTGELFYPAKEETYSSYVLYSFSQSLHIQNRRSISTS